MGFSWNEIPLEAKAPESSFNVLQGWVLDYLM